MKFSEDILNQFDLNPIEDREPVNVMQVSEMLDFMKAAADRIVLKSHLYLKSQDADVEADCIDIVTAKLNDFTQVFRDLILFMRQEEGTQKNNTSLRYCVTSFSTFDFEISHEAETFLRELLLRNEITHDYFNRELHQRKLIWIMQNCSDGAVEVYEHIYRYCKDKQLLDRYAEKIV